MHQGVYGSHSTRNAGAHNQTWLTEPLIRGTCMDLQEGQPLSRIAIEMNDDMLSSCIEIGSAARPRDRDEMRALHILTGKSAGGHTLNNRGVFDLVQADPGGDGDAGPGDPLAACCLWAGLDHCPHPWQHLHGQEAGRHPKAAHAAHGCTRQALFRSRHRSAIFGASLPPSSCMLGRSASGHYTTVSHNVYPQMEDARWGEGPSFPGSYSSRCSHWMHADMFGDNKRRARDSRQASVHQTLHTAPWKSCTEEARPCFDCHMHGVLQGPLDRL